MPRISLFLIIASFIFFLTSAGPFIDRREVREYMMTWQIYSDATDGLKESKVLLKFVDFPEYYIGEYSNDLSSHLKEKSKQTVKVLFEVRSDYGKIRMFKKIEIDGLRGWQSEWCFSSVVGSPSKSTWK